MTETAKRGEIASRPASEIEDDERPGTVAVAQQRVDVLRDVVIARTFPEPIGAPLVVAERDVGDLAEIAGSEPVVSQEAARGTSSGGASRRTER